MLFPAMHQLRFDGNKNYLHSLWLGISVPLLNLPRIIYNMILMPIFRGLIITLRMLVEIPFHGAMGRIDAKNVTLDEAFQEALARMRAQQFK